MSHYYCYRDDCPYKIKHGYPSADFELIIDGVIEGKIVKVKNVVCKYCKKKMTEVAEPDESNY